jgi:hypothetical protein
MLAPPLCQEWSQGRMPFLLGQEAHNHVAHGFVVGDERLKGGSPGIIGGHRGSRDSFCTEEIHDRLNKSVLTAEQADHGLSRGPRGSGHLIEGDLVYPAAQKEVIKRRRNSLAKALGGGGAGSLTVGTRSDGYFKILEVIQITHSNMKYTSCNSDRGEN